MPIKQYSELINCKPRAFTMRLPRLLLCGLAMSFLTSCTALTLGPQTHTDVVIVRAGHPLECTQNIIVKGQSDTGVAVQQDAGGWMFMPKEHFDALMNALDEKAKKEKKP